MDRLQHLGLASLASRLTIWASIGVLSLCLGWFGFGSSMQQRLKNSKTHYNQQQVLLQQKNTEYAKLRQQVIALNEGREHYHNAPKIASSLDLNAVSEKLSHISKQYNLKLIHLLPMGNGSEDFYRFFDIQTKLQGSYQNLARFTQALSLESEYPFAIQEVLMHYQDDVLHGQPHLIQANSAPSPLGIQLRMRGYCCVTNTSSASTQSKSRAGISKLNQAILSVPKASVIDSPLIDSPLIDDPFNPVDKTLNNTAQAIPIAKISITTPRNTEQKRHEPLITIAPVRYTRAQKVADLLGTLFGDSAGSVAVDARTNALILNSQGKALQDTQDAILALDVPIQQVLIEAIIVIARHDFSKRLGLRLSLGDTNASNPQSSPNILNTGAGIVGNIAFSFLNNRGQLQVALDAMESDGHGQIISRPRLVTSNLQTAYIKAGTQIPFQESAPNGRTTVQFRDAVLRLDVTPTIMPDNKIRLDLIINQDAPGAAIDTGDGRVPSIDTTELRTQILIKSHETVALGGVFRFDSAHSKSKTPLLGDLPLLGYLFRHTNKSIIKSETMFFITPHLLDND